MPTTPYVTRPATGLCLVLLAATAAAGRAQQPDIGEAIVAEMNAVRTDPSGYARNLEAMLPRFQGMEYHVAGEPVLLTTEGAAAVREAIQALRSTRPLPALAWEAGLARAAADHARDQGNGAPIGHTGSDGSTIRTRIERYGRWSSYISENISYGSATARDVVIQLLVDDGVSSRGHRRNILSPEITVAGAACGPHGEYRVVCVVDHAGGFTASDDSPDGGKANRPRPSGLPRPRP